MGFAGFAGFAGVPDSQRGRTQIDMQAVTDSVAKGCSSAESASKTIERLRTLGFRVGVAGITVSVHATPSGETTRSAIIAALQKLKSGG